MDKRASLILGGLAAGALVYRQRRSRRAVERVAAAALESLMNAIEANDETTGMHARRVAAGALIIADAIGLDERRQRAIERIALFHDIGKIHEALFDIVHERTRLTPADRRAIDTHPARGAAVLQPLAAFYPELSRGVLSHHERWDGKGYPNGLRGRRIPLEARIVTIADTFDAVAHSRPYRHGRGAAAAAAVLLRGRGTQFDPELVDVALLPPVLAALANIRTTHGHERHGRRAHQRERAPDVSFRWRSESLGARRVSAARKVE